MSRIKKLNCGGNHVLGNRGLHASADFRILDAANQRRHIRRRFGGTQTIGQSAQSGGRCQSHAGGTRPNEKNAT